MELYADILSYETQDDTARFLARIVIAQSLYQIDFAYSGNHKEFRGEDLYAFAEACKQRGI